MPEILEMLHLPQQDSVAQMQIGRRGIESCFHAQWPARFFGLNQALAQFFFPDQIREPLFQICKLFVDGHSI